MARPKKESLDPMMQELVDQALASGDPMGFMNELIQQVQGYDDDGAFEDNPRIELPDPPLHPSLVTVRVDIVDAQPPIWRRLELRGDLTLDEVHEQLQAAFGWSNSHLHQFEVLGSERRGAHFVTDFDVEEGEAGTHERDAQLDQVLRKPGERLCYIYDFGDFWEHDLTVESARPATDDDPAVKCTGGRGACPPEDVGGMHTWNELAAALRDDPDPAHLTGDLAMYAEWLPRVCDPDEFSVVDANEAMSFVGAGPRDAARTSPLLGHLDSGPRDAARTSPLLGHLEGELSVEFAELLGRCPTEVRDVLGQIVGRAVALEEAVSEDDIRTTLRPWRSVLDAIGDDGVQLTAAGWLPPTIVQQIRRDSGIVLPYGKGNREQHTPELAALRERCAHAGLLRKSKGRLQPTKRGRRCRDSDDELMTAIAESLVHDKHDAVQDARVISMLFLAADWQIGPDSRWAADAAQRGTSLRPWEEKEAFWDDVAHMMNDVGWRVDENLPLTRDDMHYQERAALLALTTDGPLRGLPRSAVVRKIARAAIFV